MATAVPRRAEPGVLAIIAIGGALGTLSRYEVGQAIHVAKGSFPWPTFIVNMTGAFALGLFLTIAIEHFPPARIARAFVAIGFLGSFTTFSTMAVETVTLIKDGYAPVGAGYLLISVSVGLVCCVLGVRLARLVPTRAC
jgi:CrcB protein